MFLGCCMVDSSIYTERNTVNLLRFRPSPVQKTGPLILDIQVLIMFGKELLQAYELPFAVSYTPLRLFFVLNLLIFSIILISLYWDKDASNAVNEVRSSRRDRSLRLSVASSTYYHEDSRYGEDEVQMPTELQASDDEAHDGKTKSVEQKAGFHRQKALLQDFEPDAAGSHKQRQKGEEFLLRSYHPKQDDGRKKGQDDTEEENAFFGRVKAAEKHFGSLQQERPLASTRFPHKKIVTRLQTSKSPLKVSRPTATRNGDTLDATWRAICDDKSAHSSPLRHHRLHATRIRKVEVAGNSKEMSISPQKQVQQRQSSSSNLLMRRRERSMTKDELHARVESFISKFNEQIKIQHQQSLLSHNNLDDREITNLPF